VLPESRSAKRRGEVPLSEAREGQSYIVTSLHERDPKLLLFLHRTGIGPSQKLKVVSQNYDQTVSIDIPGDGVVQHSILGRPRQRRFGLGGGRIDFACGRLLTSE